MRNARSRRALNSRAFLSLVLFLSLPALSTGCLHAQPKAKEPPVPTIASEPSIPPVAPIAVSAPPLNALAPGGETGQMGVNPADSPANFGDSLEFREIWGYLQNGDEKLLDSITAVSDIGYFGAAINYRGQLYGVPNRSKLSSFKGRVHLVIAEISGQALTHFCLDPAYPVRDELIASIVREAAPYDGVQIDFEAVPASDGAHFREFLAILKKKIGKRTLSVALPARTRAVGDAFDYENVSRIVDRVIVMAYDEHWSGSGAGSIASLEWCAKVASYARSRINANKLVLGLPFYGRAWAEKNPAKAYRFSGIQSLIDEKNIDRIDRENAVPFFSYEETVRVRVFFEDAHSVVSRASLYRDASIDAIAFWRLGQEDPAIWRYIRLR